MIFSFRFRNIIYTTETIWILACWHEDQTITPHGRMITPSFAKDLGVK